MHFSPVNFSHLRSSKKKTRFSSGHWLCVHCLSWCTTAKFLIAQFQGCFLSLVVVSWTPTPVSIFYKTNGLHQAPGDRALLLSRLRLRASCFIYVTSNDCIVFFSGEARKHDVTVRPVLLPCSPKTLIQLFPTELILTTPVTATQLPKSSCQNTHMWPKMSQAWILPIQKHTQMQKNYLNGAFKAYFSGDLDPAWYIYSLSLTL